MDPESIEKYTAMAKQLNVPQGKLINVIRDQLKDDSEARRLQCEQEKKEKLQDEEKNHRFQLEAEKQKMEAEKLLAEEEARKEKLKAEEDEKNRQFQLEEIRIKENARIQQEQRELEMVRIRAQGQNNTDQNAEQNGAGRVRKSFVIEIGKWKPEVTDLNTLLCNFETNDTALEVTGEVNALELTRCLEGTALKLIQSLSQEERLDYEAIKLALQQRFRCTEGNYRKQFKTARTRPGENQVIS